MAPKEITSLDACRACASRPSAPPIRKASAFVPASRRLRDARRTRRCSARRRAHRARSGPRLRFSRPEGPTPRAGARFRHARRLSGSSITEGPKIRAFRQDRRHARDSDRRAALGPGLQPPDGADDELQPAVLVTVRTRSAFPCQRGRIIRSGSANPSGVGAFRGFGRTVLTPYLLEIIERADLGRRYRRRNRRHRSTPNRIRAGPRHRSSHARSP